MNYNKVYKGLWILLHYLADFFYFMSGIGDAIKMFCNKMYNVNLCEADTEKQIIESSIVHLTKIPENIVVIFGDKIPDISSLTKFISWIAIVGVQSISFYDYQGKFGQSNFNIFHTITQFTQSCDLMFY